ASEPRADAPDAARSGVGRGVAGAAGIPARLHGAAAQEARTGSVQPAIPRHRTVGGVSLQPERVAVRAADAAAHRDVQRNDRADGLKRWSSSVDTLDIP